MKDNNFNNIQEFENNYELRKALNKLENELQSRVYELNLTKNLYQELQELNEKKEKECNDLNIKLNTVRSDMRNIEKKLQNEIDTMKLNFAKETEIYNNKILKLSEFNPSNLQKNIEYKIENKYKQELSLKDKEIEDLTNKLSQTEQQYELLISEFEEYKINIQNEFDTQKHFHQAEVNSLLEKIRLNEDMNSSKNNSGESNDNFTQIKNELDNTRRQVTELNNEIDKLRHDKELLIIERNEHKINLIKERDKQNFDKKNLELSLNKANNSLENMARQIDSLNNALKERDYKINELMKQKQNLNEKLSNQEMEFIDMKNSIHNLNNILKSNEEENHKLFLEKEKIQKESLIKEKQEKENLQKQIDDLSIKLKDAKNSKIKKEYIYDGNNKGYKELINKLKKITEKKNQYKIKCKMAKENIEQIIQKLDEKQEKEFEKILQNTKKKYSQFIVESDDEK
jgi:chromosome segregation ATPase